MLLLLTSCSEKSIDDYNQLPIQLLTQAFDAVHQQEHELAVSRLEKIVVDEQEFINKLVVREKEGAVLKRTEDLLDSGDFEGAAKVVETGLVDCGHTTQMVQARDVVDGLRYVDAYKKKLPFTDPELADTLVNGLPQPKLFNNNLAYVNWLNNQKKSRDKLLFKFRQKKAAGLLQTMDQQLLRERGNYGLTLKKLDDVISGHPLFLSVTRNAPEHGMGAEELELYQMVRFKKAPSLDWGFQGDYKPKTVSGRYLKAIGYLKTGNRVKALAELQGIMDIEDELDSALISHAVSLSKLDTRQIAPATTSLMGLIYLLQE